MEGLAGEGNEVHVVAHGGHEKFFVHSPGKFSFFERLYTAPYTNLLTLKKADELIKKHDFDLAIAQNLIPSGKNNWFKLPQLFERRDSLHGFFLRKIIEKKSLPLLYSICGITERNSFASFYAGETREIHLKQLSESDGIITLSKKQKELIEGENIRKEFFVLYPSIDTKKFRKLKDCGNVKESFSLNGFNLLLVVAAVSVNELRNFFSILSKTDKGVNLAITCNESRELNEMINEFGLRGRIKLVGQVKEQDDLIPLMSYCDAGLYLKRFGFPVADASAAVKISEYMSCSLPVLVPEMSGPIEQTGKAGIVMDEEAVEKINALYASGSLRKKFGGNARERATKEFDLKKNSKKLNKFLESIAGGKR